MDTLTNPFDIPEAEGALADDMRIKLLYDLERIDGRYGLATMCIGGGQGIAMVVERCR